ncbi:MAG: protein kinase [Candidatus Elarobacter sp.]
MGTEALLGGRYRLDTIVGHGGMATVFAAYDSVLERTVAIKLLQRGRDASGVVHERFRREALAEAKIVHPNVVAVHDVGVSDEGRPYIVMDFIDGRSLQAIVEDAPLSSERAAIVGFQLARALAVAHELGIVHRDVKPANILIDEQRVPHLTDFGLARAVDKVEADLTAPGVLVGTPHYVAPEQARYGYATAQADLYSLGAVLYFALAGVPPFTGAGALDVALRRFEEDPPDLRTRVAEVDPELAALVTELLAREPDERPAGATPVAERLADIGARLRTQRASGEGDAAPPDTPGDREAEPAPPHASTSSVAPAVAAEIPPPNSSLIPPQQWDIGRS